MPIFVYLLVQGFFYTKNKNRFIFRVFILATVTQILLFVLGYINYEYFPSYYIGVNNYLGIIYSYTLSIILINVIDQKNLIKKLTENQNLIIRINLILLIVFTYMNLKIEFDMQIPFLMLELYVIEKLFQKDNLLLLKQEDRKLKNKILYLILIFIALFISTKFLGYSVGAKEMILYSIIFIALYNGNRGKNNKLIQTLFYLVFPFQHVILYTLAMIR